jgi:hypothetical protein
MTDQKTKRPQKSVKYGAELFPFVGLAFGLLLLCSYVSDKTNQQVQSVAAEPSYREMRALSDHLDLLRVQAAPGIGHPLELEREYANLSKLYNDEMIRTNYRYTRSTDLPPEAIYVLPRSYEPLTPTP